ncbi:protein belonging to Uncharacterized protein family UPF0165 [Candidatus Magnetobacterium bavaricum]|uniref:Protein belonging to Uncharacterized protein family UPF0165 n=1 Tax=Candidatus Magnetobacterium bavaricum TaxID=29290 RepID=A0A0F3GRH8_9BACT|nr:protein belonging to Uncharacterized protein family UPF0165 [Candidatus Magnetobacterium bavaricum]
MMVAVMTRFHNGVFEPLEKVDFKDGQEVLVVVLDDNQDDNWNEWLELTNSCFARDWDDEKEAFYDKMEENP